MDFKNNKWEAYNNDYNMKCSPKTLFKIYLSLLIIPNLFCKKELIIILIGYARVSTNDQNLDRQIDSLKSYGCEKIYQEKITGTKKERPELNLLLDFARTGDVVVISELTRMSRSTKDLISIAETLRGKSIELISLKEKIDTTTATGKAMFGMLAVIAQLERDLIAERTKEGLASARARGRIGGRPPKDDKSIQLALKMYNSKSCSVSEISRATGISSSTLYRYRNKI